MCTDEAACCCGAAMCDCGPEEMVYSSGDEASWGDRTIVELAIVPFVLSECVRRRFMACCPFGSSELLEIVAGDKDIATTERVSEALIKVGKAR